MTRIARLKRSALESCNWRGHRMERFRVSSDNTRVIAYSHCRDCHREVSCDTNPLPNGIDIGGEAVALNCTTVLRFHDFFTSRRKTK